MRARINRFLMFTVLAVASFLGLIADTFGVIALTPAGGCALAVVLLAAALGAVREF